MPLAQVTVRTVEKDTTSYGGTEYKFYRTYEVPGIGTILQWGSMKSGKSGGQFKHDSSSYVARDKIGEKQNEGYTNLTLEAVNVDTDKLKGRAAKDMGQILDNMYQAGAVNPTPPVNTPTPASTPVQPKKPATVPQNPDAQLPDRLTTLNKRALEAITLASTDPIAALKELSTITDEIESIEADVRKVRSYVSTLEVLTEELV